MNELFELNAEQKQEGIDAIRLFFAEERDEDIGQLAALLLLDFIAEKFGAYFYNLGISDAKYFLQEKIEDLYSLEK